MKMLALRSQLHLLNRCSITNTKTTNRLHRPTKISTQKLLSDQPTNRITTTQNNNTILIKSLKHQEPESSNLTGTNDQSDYEYDVSRGLVVGAVSVGLLVLMMGLRDEKALALGPEGPLMEEFWDNVRRYGLYALTVSTGALYTIFQPLFELLKNPISAILILAILGGGFYLVSQVVQAMVGVTDFSYEYYY